MRAAQGVLLALLALLQCARLASASGAGAGAAGLPHFLESAAAIEPWLINTRRALHRQPELFFQEHNTSLFIRNALQELGIPFR